MKVFTLQDVPGSSSKSMDSGLGSSSLVTVSSVATSFSVVTAPLEVTIPSVVTAALEVTIPSVVTAPSEVTPVLAVASEVTIPSVVTVLSVVTIPSVVSASSKSNITSAPGAPPVQLSEGGVEANKEQTCRRRKKLNRNIQELFGGNYEERRQFGVADIFNTLGYAVSC